jgi:predicted Zn-dependent peptidase
MNYRTVNYERLGETLYEYEHKSGLKAFLVKKPGYNKKTALFGTNYGSIDSVFKIQGSDKVIRVPDGIAHFLEHKLFEQEDGVNMLDKFSKLGSSPNAFTSFNQTVYYFSCTDLFEENFKMLLDYVQHPWLTDENVEKEKGIIGQEIRMYQDNADWRVFFNLLDCFYVKHPVKLEIAGTIESVSQITKELLYDCYNTFYTPSNMAVIAVGDLNPDEVFSTVDNMIQFKDRKVEKEYPEEPEELNKEYNEQKLAVSMPLFFMGVKDNVRVSGIELLKRRAVMGMILSYTMGRSSALFNELYDKGLINESFRFEASLDQGYGYLAWGGQSSDPKKTAEIIGSALKDIFDKGIDPDAFSRIKKAHIGGFIRSLNSVESIAREMMDSFINGASYFELGRIYDELDASYANKALREVFNNKTALSVINPQ